MIILLIIIMTIIIIIMIIIIISETYSYMSPTQVAKSHTTAQPKYASSDYNNL